MKFISFFSLFLSLSLISSNSYADCTSKKLAMDIGSGSLKSALYEIDSCTREIKELKRHNYKLKYEKCLTKDKKGNLVISDQCMSQTKIALASIQDDMGVKCGYEGTKCSAIATAWARKAGNVKDVIAIYKENNINISPLTQEQEGVLGYNTLIDTLGADKKEKAIVFDIGGGSFQLSTQSGGEIVVLNGPHGVESFHKYLTQKFIKDSKRDYFTPEEIDIAVNEMAEKVAQMLKSKPNLLNAIHDKDGKVYAIGRPMFVGMSVQMEMGELITQKMMNEAAKAFSGKTVDDTRAKFPQLPEHYLQPAQTSLIIVEAIMKGAEIDEMHISEAHQTDYIVRSAEFWLQ